MHRRRGALAALTVAVALLGGCTTTSAPVASTSSPASPTPAPSPSSPVAVGSPWPSAGPGSVPGLPGWLYYGSASGAVYRLTATGPAKVLADAGATVTFSPDGRWLAYFDHDNNLVVAGNDGTNPRTVMHGGVGAGYEPAWSPDSTRVITAQAPNTVGVVDIASGGFTPQPVQVDGIHFLWSADGRHLGYATGTCRLGVAAPDGYDARLVPVIGDPDPKVNPDRRRSCDPVSISPDGSRMAVNLHTGNMDDGDIGRDPVSNAVVDLKTGATVKLPVPGTVEEMAYRSDGALLVRNVAATTTYLTLLGPDLTVVAQVEEPVKVRGMWLLGYTR